ncbi:HlyD family efflux transporter periplasmic adaptor subunit [Sinimarinibacterium sp. CAU 1509]|uniref:HlyD family efflux transporter periplasmic adaptor subunit n=1 Tax=Sinimarinibacterium sp. CAU 1509 TaxID=2562283 RepID=UPI0010AD1909|nr:HlyD family efflux transporter periplasmic adaptor subunit [Sinimarinibacterium sp. CAU 1509]TJY58978.1 HlyD family efflux transporter periplasmic adaptor subunit [Sinimarinibacterium sp. CAU 1509]
MDLEHQLFARTQPLGVSHIYKVVQWISLALVITAIWANWATIDEQVRAPGTVIVSSRSQVVQAVDGGVLIKLAVHEGDTVKAGDLIAELDPVRFQASSNEVLAKITSLKATIQRLEAELDERPLEFSDDVLSSTDVVQAQTRLYQRRLKLQKEEEEAISQSIKFASQELSALEDLAKTGDAAKTEVLRSRRTLNELQGSLTNKHNAYRQDALSELTKSRSELEQAQQVLRQRNEALDSTKLRAPMSGTVKNVRYTTLGAVLRAGEELLQIVPSDEPLMIEAKVSPADVAFVRLGLKANVKLDAYDYTVYGSLKGHVLYISPDTLEDENAPRDEKAAYRVHVQIDEIPERSRKDIDIIPGMTAKVEIITGERTVAQYLLKPIRRVGSNALVER